MAFNHLQPSDGPFVIGAGGSVRVWVVIEEVNAVSRSACAK